MYIHIGADVSIPAHWIMGIFDLDRLALTGPTADFLKQAEKDNKLDLMTPDLPRSLIVTMDRVFMSPVSTATLRARLMGRQGDSKG
ncbi:MAG TPA: extracellular matrix/biofilm biosynthesis regulator RemA family protein [Clostridia bacterium]|nr:DUF370 domain-containing protein [Clostridiaceae bacterium]HZK42048.1 extracellular matrix/biofilm biosynthesis regulator RemA family protein [Clostridia bacterium]